MKALPAALAVVLTVPVLAAASGRPVGRRALLPPEAGYVTSLAFDPHAAGTLYVGTISGRVYRSRDDGRSWRLVAAGWGRVDALAVDARPRGAVYAGTQDGVFQTRDGGRTWRFDGLPPSPLARRRGEGWVSAIAVDPSNGDVVYARVGYLGGRLRKSTNGGRTWRTVLSVPLRAGSVGSFGLAPTRPASVYAIVSRIRADSAGGFSVGERLFASRDGGRSWRATTLLPRTPTRSTAEPALAVAPGRPATLYATLASRGGVVRSDDAGVTWHEAGDGLPAANAGVVLAVDPRRAGTAYAAVVGRDALYRTTDGGRTWTGSTAVEDLGIGLLAVDPRAPSTLFAVGWPLRGAVRRTPVLRSRDGGRTWAVTG